MHNRLIPLIFILLYLLLGGGVVSAATEGDLNQELFSAASKGDITKVESLVEQGAGLAAQNHKGRTALVLAAEEGHLNVVNFLLEKGSNANTRAARGRTALIQAAKMGHAKVVKALLEHGANINAKTDKGRTALLQSARNGYPEVVKVLLEYDAVDLDATRKDGMTALMLAAELGDFTIVEMLVSKGANTGLKNAAEQKAYDLTANEDIRKLLQ